jgi:cytochrome b561
MKFLLSPAAENIIFITALINIVLVLVLFFTCRFVPSFKMTRPLINKKWFKTLYKFHSNIWWLLAPSVVIHAVIALLHKLSGG